MKKALIIASLMFSQIALAETITYEVKGMHCEACANSIKEEVCKMQGLEKCDVTVGKVIITPKAGTKVSQDQVQSMISKAGNYQITGSSKSK